MCWVLLACSHGLFSTFAHCPLPKGLASVQTYLDGFSVLLTSRFWVGCSPWEGPSEKLEGGRVRSEYQFPWFFLEGWLLPSTKGQKHCQMGLALAYRASNWLSPEVQGHQYPWGTGQFSSNGRWKSVDKTSLPFHSWNNSGQGYLCFRMIRAKFATTKCVSLAWDLY